jgi:hypothetical protein
VHQHHSPDPDQPAATDSSALPASGTSHVSEHPQRGELQSVRDDKPRSPFRDSQVQIGGIIAVVIIVLASLGWTAGAVAVVIASLAEVLRRKSA